MGYPLGVTLIQTIFSKVLGPRPQGVWMGLLTGSGCLSRVLGPIFVAQIYTNLGTYYTFGITGLMMTLAMIWLLLFDKRLIPPIPNNNNNNKIQNHDVDEIRSLNDNKKHEIPLDEITTVKNNSKQNIFLQNGLNSLADDGTKVS